MRTRNLKKPDLVKGKATYKLEAPHYRKGVLMPKGAKITVENEIPSRTWTRIDGGKPAVESNEEKPKNTGRPSDRDI